MRWEAANYAWLVAQAELRGVGVGTVAQAVVSAARLADGSALVKGGVGVPGQMTVEEGLASVGAGRVAAGAAPVPRPGAAPARRSRLDVVVARQLDGGSGPITPISKARALRLIREGRVDVSGVAAGVELDPAMLVGAGEVLIRDA